MDNMETKILQGPMTRGRMRRLQEKVKEMREYKPRKGKSPKKRCDTFYRSNIYPYNLFIPKGKEFAFTNN
ncbi:hypothetical protein CR513_37703, partial [Mucuna pruriens]